MASRSSRSSVKESPATGSKPRAPSPLSPTKVSRTEEKRTLISLNKRLSDYIAKVRSLENENDKLQQQMTIIEENNTTEVISVKNMYDKELRQARCALDDLAKDKAKWEIEAERHKSGFKEMQTKFNERQSELDKLDRSNKVLETQLADVRRKNDDLSTERTRLNEEMRNLKPDYEKMKNKLADAQKNLEDETLRRIDLQNQLQTAQEEAKFNNSILTQQLNESKMRKQIEIEEIDGTLQSKYNEELESKIQEMRDKHSAELKENKQAFSDYYEKRIDDLNSKLQGERGSAASAIHEMREANSKMTSITSKNTELENTNATLTKRLKDLQETMDDQSRAHRSDMAKKDHEIDYLNDQNHVLTKDYQDLLEVKVELDREIGTYKTLLDGEELRLGLSQSNIEADTTDTGRGRKRKRLMESEEYTGVNVTTTFSQPGVLLIEPLEENVQCIKVRNTGDSEESLSGISLKSVSEGLETVYKFHRTVKVAPGGLVSVWSSDSGEEHMPAEGQLVMKEGAWKFGDMVETLLVDKEGEVLASRETKKEKESFGSSRKFAGRRLDGGADADKNCSIM